MWERTVNDTNVDANLFCADSKLSIRDFACGYIQKGNRNLTILEDGLQKHNPYCLNISNCLQPLPFICEVNCTEKDSLCKNLFDGNSNQTLFYNR